MDPLGHPRINNGRSLYLLQLDSKVAELPSQERTDHLFFLLQQSEMTSFGKSLKELNV